MIVMTVPRVLRGPDDYDDNGPVGCMDCGTLIDVSIYGTAQHYTDCDLLCRDCVTKRNER